MLARLTFWVLNRENTLSKIKFLIGIHKIPSVKFAISETQFAKISSLEIFFYIKGTKGIFNLTNSKVRMLKSIENVS